MAYFSSRYMITDGVKMTEVALGLRYFHPSCFHPFLDSSSYLVWTLKCLWNVRPAFSRKKSNFQKCRPMSKSPSGMNQSRILINTVTCYAHANYYQCLTVTVQKKLATFFLNSG